MKIWKYFIFAISFVLFHQVRINAAELNIIDKKIVVNGLEASVFAIAQPDGTLGIRANKGQAFDVLLNNTMKVPTSIHWHGLILPNDQDGVAFVTQFPIYPGLSYRYRFPLVQSGTYWMHSHFGLQEQRLLSAPLIIYEPNDAQIADQEAILFLADFSFKSPAEIYRNLRCSGKDTGMNSMKRMSSQDIVEVDYDAFLMNYRVLENPEIVKVEPGKKIRLRVINGASATNFFILLGSLEGEVIAVDGNKIKPVRGDRFELAVAQRLDIVLTIPNEGGFFPIIAQGEGTDKQAGLVLTTKSALPHELSGKSSVKAPPFTNLQEMKFHALNPLAKKPLEDEWPIMA
jgi:FtsP/CotA-like multicopper oxidase with cupredoxin domain